MLYLILFIVITVFDALLLVLAGMLISEKDRDGFTKVFFIVFIFSLFSAGCLIEYIAQIPKAIDVYRGNTEMKVNGVMGADSVFVPKDTTILYIK